MSVTAVAAASAATSTGIDSLGHVKYAEQATEPAQHARQLGHVGGSLTCRYVLIVQDTPVDQVPRDRVEPRRHVPAAPAGDQRNPDRGLDAIQIARRDDDAVRDGGRTPARAAT